MNNISQMTISDLLLARIRNNNLRKTVHPRLIVILKKLCQNLFLFSIIILTFPAYPAQAHLPHDDITLMEISPNYDLDGIVLIAVRNNLLRSENGGESWKRMVNGLDYRSELSAIAIPDNFDESRAIFVSSESDGVFKSEDSGESWRCINSELGTRSISHLFIPSDYETKQEVLVAAGKGGLIKMDGSGAVWDEIAGSEGRIITIIAEGGEGLDRKLLVGDTQGSIFVYDDIRQSLEPYTRVDSVGSITAIGLPPDWRDGEELLVGTEKGGLKRGNLGSGFTQVPDVPGDGPIMSIAFSPDYHDDTTIYVSTWDEAVYITQDGGDSWEKHSRGLTTDKQADQGNLPHFRLIKMSNGSSEERAIFLNAFDGLFKSNDSGFSWRQIETVSANIIVSFDISPDYRDARRLVLSTYAGAAFLLDRTYDNSWSILNNDMGYQAIRRTAIQFSPNYCSDGTLISTSNDSLWLSPDSGERWKSHNIRNIRWLPRRVEKLLSIGCFGKTEFNRPWIPTLVVPSPAYASDKTIFLGTRKNGVLRSTNDGMSFKSIWKSQGDEVDSVIVSPEFPEDKTVFLSSSVGSGVYRSSDGGDTWKDAGNGLEYDGNTIVLAISPNFKTDETLFAGTTEGIFKTIDMGGKWRKLPNPSGDTDYVEAISISPNYAEDLEVLVSVRGKGLFKTNDGGETFRPIGTALIAENYSLTQYQDFPERSTPIKYSPSYAVDRTIYAISGDKLFVSENGGEDWIEILRPLRYEDVRSDFIIYEKKNDWERQWFPTQFGNNKVSASGITFSSTKGADATYGFFGTGVCWIGTENSDQGIANIYIDGQFKGQVDQYRSTGKTGARLFTIQKLKRCSHEIRIEVSGEKNEASTGYSLVVDAFDVFP
ncbi:MAG: hypothetical protein HKM93_13360 [Desulfobacteraceae bacterium]|nr:hypothetical protein [Desulfobacteraceae bacterium]